MNEFYKVMRGVEKSGQRDLFLSCCARGNPLMKVGGSFRMDKRGPSHSMWNLLPQDVINVISREGLKKVEA